MGSQDEASPPTDLAHTPLHGLHLELGGKMVPFAGYAMPVQYPAGIMTEHLHTRAKAGLFDVSHMGQAYLAGPDHETTAAALEALTPGNFAGLGQGQQRYTLLLNDDGGIIDDFMVSRSPDDADNGRLFLIVNAARKHVDYDHIRANLPGNVTLETADDKALLALQGPHAADVLSAHCPAVRDLKFMGATPTDFDGIPCHISRSGYTGEDGYEISVAASKAVELATALLASDTVLPIGLGARDSLRLEAGLCLYGHDIDETTSPIEADLKWAIPKRRREEANFPGAERILRELDQGPQRRRVGVQPLGRAPAREGAPIETAAGEEIGVITSGGFGPSAQAPVAMGYVAADKAETGTKINLMVRGKAQPAKIADLPFVPHRYYR